jgi:putative phage-type endonuclease
LTETNKPYRVAQSAADTRQRWLQERRTGIGGSDAAVVLGLSPWKSRYELWTEKSGSLPDEHGGETTPHLDLGNNLEAVVLRLLALRTGRQVEAAERYTLVRNADNPWCFCTPDGWVWDNEDARYSPSPAGIEFPAKGIVQAKTAFSLNKHDWDEEPPDYYRVQLQHEMLASGCAWGTLCVLFIDQGVLTRLLNASFGMVYDASRLACAISDHCDFRFFDYEADAEFQADLLAAEQAFMGLIDAGVAPSTDESESCRRAIHRLHPRDSGASVNLPDEWIEHTARLAELKSQKSITEKEIGELENALKALIGDATYGVLPDGSRWAWKTQNRKEYVVAASELRVLRKEKGKA